MYHIQLQYHDMDTTRTLDSMHMRMHTTRVLYLLHTREDANASGGGDRQRGERMDTDQS
jgi:hypothetical protein